MYLQDKKKLKYEPKKDYFQGKKFEMIQYMYIQTLWMMCACNSEPEHFICFTEIVIVRVFDFMCFK